MIRVFFKNGSWVDVPKAEEVAFVFKDELEIKTGYSHEILASFPHDKVSGFMVMDDPVQLEPEAK